MVSVGQCDSARPGRTQTRRCTRPMPQVRRLLAAPKAPIWTQCMHAAEMTEVRPRRGYLPHRNRTILQTDDDLKIRSHPRTRLSAQIMPHFEIDSRNAM